jgi:Peptidase family S64
MVKKERFSERIEMVTDAEKEEVKQMTAAAAKLEKEEFAKWWRESDKKRRSTEGVAQAVEAGPLDGHNIRGYAISEQMRDGRFTGKPCITVYTEIKAHPKFVDDDKLIPPVYSGFAVDVVQSGILRSRLGLELEQASIDPKRRYRPARPGVSIGHISITAGTLGCLCTSANEDSLILSNNHVLADRNKAKKGDTIVQPGMIDGGNDPNDEVAELSEFINLNFNGGENFVDAAIARPTDSKLVSPEILEIGRVRNVACNVPKNTPVQKFGRTTGHTSGSISGVNGTVRVSYGDAGTALFRGVYVINSSPFSGSFSAGGDSGSLIVTNSNNPVALLFGGSEFQTDAIPICKVMEDLNIDGIL